MGRRRKKKHADDPRRLTTFLKELGGETIIGDDGKAITRDEALAKTLWDIALGQPYVDDEGKTRIRPPDKAVGMFIIERREGRIPMSVQSGEQLGATAAAQIDDLALARLNAEADELVESTNRETNPGKSVPEKGADLDVSRNET